MIRRPLGRTGLHVSPVGLGTVKIGRTRKLRYADAFTLPSEDEAGALLNGALDAGINLIDTAPAYGLAEQRIGRHLADRRDAFVLSTKAGECFDEATATSRFDFTGEALSASLQHSLQALRTDRVDLWLLHSEGDDLSAMGDDAVATMLEAKARGEVRCVGLSGKTVAGATAALAWADVLMVEFHADDDSHREVMRAAHARGVGVLVKKGLASGRHAPSEAIGFLMAEPSVDAAVIGTRSLDHLLSNAGVAAQAIASSAVSNAGDAR